MRLSSYSQKESTIEPPSGLPSNPARELARSFNIRVIIFLLLHMPLALVMELVPLLSTAHAIIVLLYGLRAALMGRTTKVIYSVAYIAAAEVLWRMSRAYILWEYGKYAMILVIFVAIVVEWRKQGETPRIRNLSPVLLLIAFAPGIILTIMEVGLFESRDPLSFNLSGHLAIVMLALYLWGRTIDRYTAVRTLLAIMAPAVGITFLAVYYTVTGLENLTFVEASNWLTSGSYGPNQVANIMGFGALAGAMLFVLIPQGRGARVFVLLMTLMMLGQGVLTFSRGGIYSFILALAVFGFHLMNTPRARGRFLALFTLFTIILFAVVYPFLDDFTGGTLTQRFSDFDSTGRLEAAQADLEAFKDNPIIGVGVGQTVNYHQETMGFTVSVHTEFTRMLAEHGLFGVFAIAIMIWMLLNRYLSNPPGLERAVAAAFSVWSISIMMHSAMRLAAIPLAFSLALVLWQLQQETEADAALTTQPIMTKGPDGR